MIDNDPIGRRDVAKAGCAAGGCGLGLIGGVAFVVLSIAAVSIPSCQFNLKTTPSYEACTTGIFFAAAQGDVVQAERLLEMSPPGTTNSDGRSVLYCAASGSGPLAGRVTIARLVLDRGADPNRANAAGDTPLLWAADKGEIEMVKLLVERGADPDLANQQRQTPLLRATYARKTDTALLLLDRKADPNIAGEVDPLLELLVLTDAARRGTGRPDAWPGSTAVAYTGTAPLPPLFSPNAPRTGYPPLVVAASYGDEALVAKLIQHGAAINVVAGPGVTPLFAAALQGNARIVGVLLLAGADPDFGVTPGAMTPQAVAELGHHEDAAALLAEAKRIKTGG